MRGFSQQQLLRLVTSVSGVFFSFSVPNFQTVTSSQSFRAGNQQPSEQPQHFLARIQSQFSAGRNHRLTHNDKFALSSQRAAHRYLLRCEEVLIEPSHCIESFPGAEDKTSASEPGCAKHSDEYG